MADQTDVGVVRLGTGAGEEYAVQVARHQVGDFLRQCDYGGVGRHEKCVVVG